MFKRVNCAFLELEYLWLQEVLRSDPKKFENARWLGSRDGSNGRRVPGHKVVKRKNKKGTFKETVGERAFGLPSPDHRYISVNWAMMRE